jgi:peptidoglycan/xylan/chitin deacetylase (PgdA/CDA1 family)
MKPHGIMFHHFHDHIHIKGQGSIFAEELEAMIRFLQRNKVILSAEEWYNKALNNRLNDNEICITFDDGLKCQFDIAYPVLERFNIKAFWFVYTSPLEGVLERLEVFRYFRFKYFDNIDDFYRDFFKYIKQSEYNFEVTEALNGFIPSQYLKDCTFYTDNDRTFRYLRDQVLKPYRYNLLMDKMLVDYRVDLDSLKNILWITKENLKELYNKGHMIGLHTHTHPTLTESFDKVEQMNEYKRNSEILCKILGKHPVTMSHPCNSYNNDTISILEELNVKLGFRANMNSCLHSMYEFPREDHANILKQMRLEI